MLDEKTPSAHFLDVRDLEVYYTSGGEIIRAVNGVSLYLERGKTLGLVGETGAGKTTIAKAILRILPDPPAKLAGGEIWLDGEELLQKPEHEMLDIRGGKISMIFQDPMTALNPTMTVGVQISEVIQLHNRKMSRTEVLERTYAMLELVGIPRTRYMEYPHQFSGGMKQRVVIAMALACSPELLLADEPTTALDVTIQAQVLKMIKSLRDQSNTALILITHDLGVVANIADTVAVVYAGEVVEYGVKEDVYLHPKHPYTLSLFNAIPNLESKVSRLENIPGLPPDPVALPEGCFFAPRCKYAADFCRSAHPALDSVAGEHTCRCARWAELGKEDAT